MLVSTRLLASLSMINRYLFVQTYSFKDEIEEIDLRTLKNKCTVFSSPPLSKWGVYMKRIAILAALAFAVLAGTVAVTAFPATQAMADSSGGCSGPGC